MVVCAEMCGKRDVRRVWSVWGWRGEWRDVQCVGGCESGEE